MFQSVQISLKLAVGIINVFLLFHYFLPLKKGMVLHLSFTHGCFVPSLVEIGLMVLERMLKM